MVHENSKENIVFHNLQKNYFNFETNNATSIKLYKISGEYIKDVEVNSFNTMIEKKNLKSGAYIYKIINKNQFVQSGTIIFK
tara:strand:- start:372 stop:617 length:246 start_codon:yes stop_codon:yes gene_type:complete